MTAKPRHVHAKDLRGYGRLAIDATLGITELVETMHHNIARTPGILGKPTQKPTTGITGLVYRSIRGVTRLVGGGIDLALAQLSRWAGEEPSSAQREAVLAAVNGVLGDHLAESGNPLAIAMGLRREGKALVLAKAALPEAVPAPSGRILVLAHGLCRGDLQWRRNGHDHGAELARDPAFGQPFTPVYLHYNSGLHISLNGRAFAGQLEALAKAWPVPVDEIAIVAHSMGGLVARSACYYGQLAGHDWPRHLKKIVFLGTPHDGAPLERGGNWVDVILDGSPYTTAFARLGKLRSAGITDLRHGNVLDEDWVGRDRFRPSKRRPFLPLPEGVQCFAIAASIAKKAGSLKERLLGDGLVPLRSALGERDEPGPGLAIPAARKWVGYGMNHLDLLDRREVYERVRDWLA